MQRLGGGVAPLVVVDYAHSPDALEKVLAALRPAVAAGGELVCVFGCGGDRDRASGREMGASRRALADRVVVTSDNPRSEDPGAIARARSSRHRATPATAGTHVELDRARGDPHAPWRGARRRRRAGRRQGARGLPGAPAACARRSPTPRSRGRGAGGGGAAHDGHGHRRARRAAAASSAASVPLRARDDRHAHARAAATSSSRSSGERFDGHDFVADGVRARRRGGAGRRGPRRRARAATSSRCRTRSRRWARSPRTGGARFALPVAVVVGSNGKTTVKEMLAAILRAHFGDDARARDPGQPQQRDRACRSRCCDCGADTAPPSIELGMNHPGETATLAAIAQPTRRAWSTTRSASTRNSCAASPTSPRSTRRWSRALPAGGTAVLNADDAFVGVWRDRRARRRRRVVDFALDHPAAVRGRHAGAPRRRRSSVCDRRRATPTVRLAAPGRHNAANALAAAAAALGDRRSAAAVVRGLEAFRPVAGRLVALQRRPGATVIDDTYNANPDSVRAAIEVLAAHAAPRWLVLGDMGEVGAHGPGASIARSASTRGRRHRRAATPSARWRREAAAAFGAGAAAPRVASRRCSRSRRRGDPRRRHDGAGQGLALHADGARGRGARRRGAAPAGVALMLLWLTEFLAKRHPRVQRLRLHDAARGAGAA